MGPIMDWIKDRDIWFALRTMDHLTTRSEFDSMRAYLLSKPPEYVPYTMIRS